jgi:hypothetical protein
MPIPFFNTLPKSARQALPIIQSGVARGLSSRAITQSILDAGIRISRGRSVLPAMRALKQLEAQGRAIADLSGSRRINARRLPPAVTDLKKAYRYRVRLEGLDQAGEASVKHLFITTDDPNFTPNMIKDEARRAIEGRADAYGLSEIQLFLERGEQRADLLDFTATKGGRLATSG